MKKKKAIITAVAVVLAVILIVAAFVMLKADSFGMTRSQRNKTLVTVGQGDNKQIITLNEFAVDFYSYYNNIDTYNMYAIYYGYGEYRDVSTPEAVDALKREMLEEKIEERAIFCIAAEYGITLTPEDKAAAEEEGNKAFDELMDSYVNQYAQYGYSDPKSQATSAVAEYLTTTGIGSKKEYVRRATVSAESGILRDKVVAKLIEESGITEADAERLYPDWAAFYQEAYYEGIISAYDGAFIQGQVPTRYLYIPEEGFVFMRVITVTDADRAAEIVADINGDPEKFQTYCKSEENMDLLMPLIGAEDGYAISAADSSFDPAVYAAVSGMNVGDIQLVVVAPAAEAPAAEAPAAEAPAAEAPAAEAPAAEAPAAEAPAAEEPAAEEPAAEAPAAEAPAAEEPATYYYIVMRIDGQTGIVPFEKVKDAIAADVVNDAQNEYADKVIHEWIETEGNVTIDEDVLAMIKG